MAPSPLHVPAGTYSNAASTPTSAYLTSLRERSKAWAQSVSQTNPTLLPTMEQGQSPKLLWIGCSDSRTSPTAIMDLPPGIVFEHRNIGNIISPDDPSAMAAVMFAIKILKVPDIVVCGHTGCTGVATALAHQEAQADGSIDVLRRWLMPARDVYAAHKEELTPLPPAQRTRHLETLNAKASVLAIANSPAAQAAWAAGQPLSIHAWKLTVGTGVIDDLDFTISSPPEKS